jgi:hypothetical protein
MGNQTVAGSKCLDISSANFGIHFFIVKSTTYQLLYRLKNLCDINKYNNNLHHYHKGLSARGFSPTAGLIGLAEPSLIPCVFVSPIKVDYYKAIAKDFVL